MASDVNVLHHIGLITADMPATVERYERLGFTFTPLSIPRVPLAHGGPPEPLGAGNRTAIFRNNYLEMLGIVDAERWAQISVQQRGPFDLDAPMRRYEGLHVLHLGTDDLEAVHARLAHAGVATSCIRPFQRMIDTPSGHQMMYAKSISFPPDANPEALVQIAQHLTPELVLQPRFMDHANGAVSNSEIIVCVADAQDIAEKYGRYVNRTPERRGSVFVVNLGDSRIIVADAHGIADVIPQADPPVMPWLAGFTVVTSDLDRARSVLTSAEAEFVEFGGRLVVAPSDACGCAVLFEAEGSAR